MNYLVVLLFKDSTSPQSTLPPKRDVSSTHYGADLKTFAVHRSSVCSSEVIARSLEFEVRSLGLRFGEPPREPRFDFRRLSRSDSTELVEVFARPHNEKSVGSSALNLAPSHA